MNSNKPFIRGKVSKDEIASYPRIIHCGLASMKVVEVEGFGGVFYTLKCLHCKRRFRVNEVDKDLEDMTSNA